jgi:hypothetical protein
VAGGPPPVRRDADVRRPPLRSEPLLHRGGLSRMVAGVSFVTRDLTLPGGGAPPPGSHDLGGPVGAENVQAARDSIEAWSEGARDRHRAVFADDAVLQEHGTGRTVQGAVAIGGMPASAQGWPGARVGGS